MNERPTAAVPARTDDFIAHVSRSLGRAAPPDRVPEPPVIDEACARLVGPDADLVATFVANASAAKLHVHRAEPDALAEAIVAHLRVAGHRTAVVTRCAAFDRIGLLAALRAAGVDAVYWDESTLDAAYDVDVGITDAWAAVAETGSIIVRSSPAHGRAVSLVPPYHVAVVARDQIVPDLIDLMARIDREGTAAGVVAITGPSKTADIEMNLVIGVHGPGAVEVFLI